MTPSSLFFLARSHRLPPTRARPSAETSVPGAAWQLHGSVKGTGALHDSQRSVSANASGSRVVWIRTRLTLVLLSFGVVTFDKVTSCSCRALSEMLPFLPFSTVRLILKIMKFYATFVLS